MSERGHTDSVLIAWTAYQRRVASMEAEFGYTTVFLGRAKAGWRKAWSYIQLALRSASVLSRTAPRVIWVQLPPLPLLVVALLYRSVARRKCAVVADCHNSMLRPPWSVIPGGGMLLSRCDMVLVHNNAQVHTATAMGVPVERVRVLPDAPATINTNAYVPNPLGRVVVVPFSFSVDEPIQEVLQAASQAPELTFVLTGNYRKASSTLPDEVPGNLRLTGFLSLEEFESLLSGADAVLGLTKFEGIQLSVANEAIGAGRPLILSDTQVLRDLFGECADFCNWRDPTSIATVCRNVVAHSEEKAARMQSFRVEWTARWRHMYARSIVEELAAQQGTRP
jgi:glycosyltransferase involved in cell wall biosynthesis